MVALSTKLTDADKAVDFTKPIAGHVSQSIKQVFTLERVRELSHAKLQIDARENITKDQFGNIYVVIMAKLMDGEVYTVTAWVGAEKWTGTEKKIVLVKEYKKFKRFSDEMMTYIQDQSFIAFGKSNLAILKARHAAKLPSLT